MSTENQNLVTCNNCGAEVEINDRQFCTNCGSRNWKKRSKIFGWSSFICIILCFLATFFVSDGIDDAYRLKYTKYNIARLQLVDYGLFNPGEWEKKVSEKALSFTESGGLDKFVNKVLDYIAYEVLEVSPEDNYLVSVAKASVRELIRSKVNVEDIKRFLEQSESRGGAFSHPKLNDFLEFLECKSKSDCLSWQTENARQYRNRLTLTMGIFIFLYLLVFFIALFSKKLITLLCYLYATLLMLYGGLLSPILDIEAKIDHFKVSLFDQQISFYDQFLMFESKSIFDVFASLIENGTSESLLIAFLVVLFSIVFPLLKLLFSLIYAFNEKVANNWFGNFLVFKSAKWSMADVFIVAIFMSYIGLRAILHNELSYINKTYSNISVMTSENTSLQAGFYLFLIFVISSIIMSNILKKSHE